LEVDALVGLDTVDPCPSAQFYYRDHAVTEDNRELAARKATYGGPLTNWAGNVTFSATQLHRPRSVAELQHVVARSVRIRALGSGHSFSRVADTSGDLVTTEALHIGVDFDESEGTATVPAGARYSDIVATLHARGRALPNLGSLPHIVIAGAAATGTHGSGDRNKCLAAAVVGMQFVGADGDLMTIARQDDGFAGSALALGALGVATRLTLATQPAFDLRQHVWHDAPLDSVLDHFDEIMGSGYSVSLLSWPHRRDVIDQIWIKSLAETEPADGTIWGARAATEPAHPVAGLDTRAASPQLGERLPWYEVLPHFRASFTPSSGDEQQTEYLIPRQHGPAAVAALQQLDLTDALQVMEIRTVAADDLWLSPAYGRDSVAAHFTWHNRDAAVLHACAEIERALDRFEPRPHWGKIFSLDPQRVRDSYPRLTDFQQLAARHDPNRKFGNQFLSDFIY
jgi:alditol oxidase